jgi:enamine deaminase RidA (YjgF/YER057c/UK114 family)
VSAPTPPKLPLGAHSGGQPAPERHDAPARRAHESRIVQPDGWPPPSGFAHGIEARGRLLFVAGQVGWDPLTGVFAGDDLAAQAAQALANLAAVLRAGGAEPHHVARMTWYVTDRAAYLAARPAVGAAYRRIMGRHYPAMSLLVVHALLEERAKVEIEATAVVPDPDPAA